MRKFTERILTALIVLMFSFSAIAMHSSAIPPNTNLFDEVNPAFVRSVPLQDEKGIHVRCMLMFRLIKNQEMVGTMSIMVEVGGVFCPKTGEDA